MSRTIKRERKQRPEKPHFSVPGDRPCQFCGKPVDPWQWNHIGAVCDNGRCGVAR